MAFVGFGAPRRPFPGGCQDPRRPEFVAPEASQAVGDPPRPATSAKSEAESPPEPGSHTRSPTVRLAVLRPLTRPPGPSVIPHPDIPRPHTRPSAPQGLPPTPDPFAVAILAIGSAAHRTRCSLGCRLRLGFIPIAFGADRYFSALLWLLSGPRVTTFLWMWG